MNQTHWLPGLVVLLAGVIAGVLFVLLSRREAVKASREPDGAPDDLDQRYQTLLGQLKELKADQHQVAEGPYRAEFLRLEREAALVLKARAEQARGNKHDQAKSQARADRKQEAASAASETFFGRHPSLKGALWGGGGVLFFVMLGLALNEETKPRVEGAEATGRSASASTTARPGGKAEPETEPEMKAAMDRVSKNPEDVAALAELSHELIRTQDFDQAQRLTLKASALDPYDVETRIHRAVLAAMRGGGKESVHELEHVAKTFPGSYEALLFAGAMWMEEGDKVRALQDFEQFMAEAPPQEQPPRLIEAVAQLRQELHRAAPIK